MKNQNTMPSSSPEQSASAETESVWDTLKDETFRGGNTIDEKAPDLKGENSRPAPSKEDLRQQVLSAYNKAADHKTQSNEDNIQKENPNAEQETPLEGPSEIHQESYNQEVDHALKSCPPGIRQESYKREVDYIQLIDEYAIIKV